MSLAHSLLCIEVLALTGRAGCMWLDLTWHVTVRLQEW